MKLSGIGVQNEFKRYYPDSNASAQLVGRTNVDDYGQEGVELMLDDVQGVSGKSLVVRDRLGRVIEEGVYSNQQSMARTFSSVLTVRTKVSSMICWWMPLKNMALNRLRLLF